MKLKILKTMLLEISASAGIPEDDGPDFLTNWKNYEKKSNELAKKLGFKILDNVSKNKKNVDVEKIETPDLKAGEFGNKHTDSIEKQMKKMSKKANLIGWKIIDYMIKKEK